MVATTFLTILLLSSIKWCVRLTGYEFFRKSHLVVGMQKRGACRGHYSALYCWMAASLAVWFVDRGVRLVGTAPCRLVQ